VVSLRTLELDLRPSYIDMMRIISKKKRAITKNPKQAAPVARPAPRRRTSSYAFSHSEGFGKLVKNGSYLNNPNEYTTSRVHIGSRGRSSSRVLPTHPEVSENTSTHDHSTLKNNIPEETPERKSREVIGSNEGSLT